jgi:hypothetical protein
MMNVMRMINTMKKSILYGDPQLTLGVHIDPVLVVSNITRYQSSPVDILNNRTNDIVKLLKLKSGVITSPS